VLSLSALDGEFDQLPIHSKDCIIGIAFHRKLDREKGPMPVVF